MDIDNYRLVSNSMSALTAVVLLAGLVGALVAFSRNGRSSLLAAAGCLVLLGSQCVYFFGNRLVHGFDGFTVVTVLGGLAHLAGIVLLLAAALLPRTTREDR